MTAAMDVADEIITLANEKGKPVSNLKLQKIMYFLNALYLVENKKPLIDDAKFEKWDYGPVIHYVYSEYSDNGKCCINKPISHIFFERDKEGLLREKKYSFKESNLSQDDLIFIKNNIDKFLCYPPYQLVRWSHKEPQWINKVPYYYDDQETINYYSQQSNKFWENN